MRLLFKRERPSGALFLLNSTEKKENIKYDYEKL